MNLNIPSNNILSLTKQLPLNEILNDIFNQIDIIKRLPCYDSNIIKFELEFRLRNKYSNINVEDFVNEKYIEYYEYLYKENKTTKYRIIYDKNYIQTIHTIKNIQTVNKKNDFETNDIKSNSNIENKENMDDDENNITDINELKNDESKSNKDDNDNSNRYFESSKLFEYISAKKDKEITNSLENHIEYTKKLTLMTMNYFIFKVSLNIETSLDTFGILNYLKGELNESKNSNKYYKEISILKYTDATIKKRRSFIMNKDARIDITYFNDNSHLEIDFSNNIYHERKDMIGLVHKIMSTIDCSNFVLDYLFLLLPNFEFQKPITPSIDLLLKESNQWCEEGFYVAAKTDGLRQLIIIINNFIFSISENFEVKLVGEIDGNLQIVFDCEFINDTFIPFDIMYNNKDLRSNSYKERINNINSFDFSTFNNLLKKKSIKLCNSFTDIQEFIQVEINNQNEILNDGIIITESQSTYYDNTKVYKIKTENTVDIKFNGHYFFAKKHKINKSKLNINLKDYKNICKLYNYHKKQNNNNKEEKIIKYYYHKQVEIVQNVPYNKKIVRYHLVKERKPPFIIEMNIATKKVIKVRKDKLTSNSLNTFKSILLASFQKVDLNIFSDTSNVLMRKYHNIIKQNILSNYKGTLLDIGTGNGGDIHKWKTFRKIVCIEPDYEKIKNLKERISKSSIKNRITIIQDDIQKVKLDNVFDVATCFFSLNDFTYSDISEMLKNIKNNIKGQFIVMFYDYKLFNENIHSPSIVYKKCIYNENNKLINTLDKQSPIYLISTLRYVHSECDNIMYINIEDSNITNHYECGINSDKVIDIFNENGFSFVKDYPIHPVPFLNINQIKYTSYLKILEFSNKSL